MLKRLRNVPCLLAVALSLMAVIFSLFAMFNAMYPTHLNVESAIIHDPDTANQAAVLPGKIILTKYDAAGEPHYVVIEPGEESQPHAEP